MKKLNLLFKFENINFDDICNEFENNELIKNISNYGIINEDSIIDYFNKDENDQLYSYTVNYDNEQYLFYEHVETLEEDGKVKHGNYKSIEIFKLSK